MKEINDIISKTSELTATAVVSELKRQGLLKDNKYTPFQKTETLLYNYKNFKSVIDNRIEEINSIREEGIPKKSNSITSFSGNISYESKTDDEKAEEKIEAIEQNIRTTMNFIKMIDIALNEIEDDPYFEIIRMKYFEGKTREEMAEHYGVDVRTISRNKNKLINLLQIKLFSDEYILQIFS